ncbi:hypothetical protein [Pseudoprimorskyibacter insulae]|uniref:Uncharacterized protein n=1 Tax=Pseudoprimorskyibacter insulae TaxID=1695997 RepID=A0A2R8AZU2_9RHOB|nr:hypothetical protein [Pseudoprimorskyibacter insulae]SPF81562.1 hypothetical protein PRI8871_03386 [Pseudoprimorskyibacter insulae]
MKSKLEKLVAIEQNIATSLGTARQRHLKELSAEVTRLVDMDVLSECQAQERLKAWSDEAQDDLFDNMPV